MDANKVMKDVEDFAKSAEIKKSPRSISSYASKAIYYFPVLCSKTVTDKNAFVISTNLEASYASFVQACFAMVPAVAVKGDVVNVEDYLKKFHQNIGISSGNEYYINNESSQPYDLFVNDILNETSLKTIRNKMDIGTKVGGEIISNNKENFLPRKLFSASETEKKNNLKPTIVKVSCSFIIHDNEVKVDIPIGVKTVVHPVNSDELCNHIMDSIANKGLIHNLIRYTTGEVLSLGDILFGISKIKNSVRAKGELGKWTDAIDHRKRLNRLSRGFLSKKPYLPNVSVILSMDDINDIEHLIGYNLFKDTNRAVKFMNDNFLLCLAIADDATETAYILYDGHSSYEEYPYSSLKRENERNADAISALIKSSIR